MKFRVALTLMLSACLLGSTVSIYAQQLQRKLNASRAGSAITVDGKLDEEEWAHAEKATGFVQNSPYPGAKSIRETEVSIIYDNTAVYIGAVMHDNPDSVLQQLTARDNFGDANTDVFVVTFDTYSDKQNGFVFGVTAAGVQADAKMKFDGSDYSWNAAWYSKTAISDKGWVVEMKIPFSALRFPSTSEQAWGVNFYRSIRRVRESSYWSTVLPNVPNFLSQAGSLTGIRDIKSPIRLTFLPYISTYAENYAGSTSNSINGGLDLKYGLNESFTLDLTLVPDFGQTVYDNKVLNLTPVEVKYDERRYFFTEGTDLFNKNDLFYSRRVGGTPVNYNKAVGSSNPSGLAEDTVLSNPSTTKLINATKISGRNRHNLGIGFFNAISEPAYATIYNKTNGTYSSLETSPLTNYNVIVLDQALKNNSYVSFVNTNVYRKQNSYNADVSALLFSFANKANKYALSGSADVSQIYGGGPANLGLRYFLQAAKTKGTYSFYFNTTSISDKFNPNDLGYLDRNNLTYYNFSNNYNTYKPFWKIISTYNHVGAGYNRVFNPDVFSSLTVYGSHRVTFTNFLTVGFYWDTQPVTSNDYLEPRTPGRFYVSPTSVMSGGFYSSDYRKKFALDVELSNRWYPDAGHKILYTDISPRFRGGDKLTLVFNSNITLATRNVGFAGRAADSIYFGTRDIVTLVNTLNAAYIFNNKMSLKIDARHYWSQATYASYSLLNSDGTLQAAKYNGSSNVDFNSFNIYTSYIWQFKPGSEISVVYQNSIYTRGTSTADNYFTNLNQTFNAPQSNSISIKVIYYLDYLTLKNAVSRNG